MSNEYKFEIGGGKTVDSRGKRRWPDRLFLYMEPGDAWHAALGLLEQLRRGAEVVTFVRMGKLEREREASLNTARTKNGHAPIEAEGEAGGYLSIDSPEIAGPADRDVNVSIGDAISDFKLWSAKTKVTGLYLGEIEFKLLEPELTAGRAPEDLYYKDLIIIPVKLISYVRVF